MNYQYHCVELTLGSKVVIHVLQSKTAYKCRVGQANELEVPALGRLAPYKWFQPLKIFRECRQTVEYATHPKK